MTYVAKSVFSQSSEWIQSNKQVLIHKYVLAVYVNSDANRSKTGCCAKQGRASENEKCNLQDLSHPDHHEHDMLNHTDTIIIIYHKPRKMAFGQQGKCN